MPPALAERIAQRKAALERALEAVQREQHAYEAVTIALAVRGHVFSARELLAHARYDAALLKALHGARTPKQVGRQLARLAGYRLEGVTVKRVARDERGCIWMAVLHDGAGRSAPLGV